ncbi:acyl-CoA dehydrogenase family protein [Polyangium aurulentum]|uniref:acyl-CoA dehydrogenase family protein n=1 Tax=Polyangium aurulentum TaxID=2567896 RepID=UPI0010AE8DCE|nr:acyl-CoA dehydrogenase family protein [Polyangium aurulentum]UQA60328.1 acyl-CoA dehydrogenase family protein [Polyangium aurulentum]
MDLSFTPEQSAFRDEVRAWLRTAMPAHIREKAAIDAHFEHDEIMEWHRILHRKGWVAPHWPAEWGGPGLDVARRFILTEELELAGAPALSPFGLSMVGPLLMQFGTEAQKKRFLPKILAGEEVWCQGYSEPNAGSDLASLKLRAEPDGNGSYVLNGQKTWTTYAQHADWIFVLTRTDPNAKKQAGISFFLADMKTPGITVRPTLTIGGTPAFCDTFFENAVVPAENLVGPLNGGWTLAKALLGHERTGIAAVGLSTRAIRRVKRIAATTLERGRPLLEHPGFRARIARLEIELTALKMANYRAIVSAQEGHAPGPESSILKIRGSEILQQCFVLAMEVMGHDSLSWFNEAGVIPGLEQWVASSFNYTRATTIYGGSNEIQRNVIAKLILNLPSA